MNFYFVNAETIGKKNLKEKKIVYEKMLTYCRSNKNIKNN